MASLERRINTIVSHGRDSGGVGGYCSLVRSGYHTMVASMSKWTNLSHQAVTPGGDLFYRTSFSNV